MIIIPDGPLNTLPLHALAYEKNINCLDCRNINFNLKKYNFSYFPSVDTFNNIDVVTSDYKKLKINFSNKLVSKTVENTLDIAKQDTAVKQLKKLKELVLKKNKSDKSKVNQNQNTDLYYLGIGDPDLYSNNQAKKIDSTKKTTMLRSLFENDKITSNSIKEIYGPVDGSLKKLMKLQNICHH